MSVGVMKIEEKQKETINRNQFLRKLGVGGAALMAIYCLGTLSSCSKENTSAGPKDFTISLDDPTYASLKTVGNFVVTNDVVIVCTGKDTFVAVTQICSHEGEKEITYRKSSNDFYCNAHGANFGMDGKGKNSNGSNGLKVYSTALTGNSLRIYGS